MAIIQNFSLGRNEAGILTITMTPAVPIGGWELRFHEQKRFGGLSGFIKTAASGYGDGVSGITVVSSGAGVFQVAIGPADTSGLEFGTYAWTAERLLSGSRTALARGYHILTPGPAV